MKSEDPLWITPQIKILMRKKDRAYHKKHQQMYIALREKLALAIATSKRLLGRIKFKKSYSIKKKWNAINNIIKPRQQPKCFTLSEAIEINDSFTKVFEPEDIDKFIIKNKNYDPATFHETNEYLVYQELIKIKSSASGPDGIPGTILRDYANILAAPLTLIFNRSFSQLKFPSAWKKAHVIPIKKKNSEYRPISLLCSAAKILEKIALKQWLTPSLQKKFNPFQFAFVPGPYKGTTNALTMMVLWSLNKLTSSGGYVRCISIDFKKAFDKISHLVVLLTAKNDFNLPDSVTTWIKSYFGHRSQKVIVSGVSPDSIPWTNITSGVPQGSVLGPFLFAMVVNGMSVLDNSRSLLNLYADDTTLLHYVGRDDIDNAQEEMNNLLSWSLRTKMHINNEKTQLIDFSLEGYNGLPITVAGSKLETQSTIKLLGMTLQNNLKWESHFKIVHQKCCAGMSAIQRLVSYGIPDDLTWKTYLALVFSHMAYAWPAFCDISHNQLMKLSAIEKRASVLCNKHPCINQPAKRLEGICLRLIKKVATLSDHPLRSLFLVRNILRNLRNSRKLQLLHPKSTRLKKSFAGFCKNS
jgi:hypothetical protein